MNKILVVGTLFLAVGLIGLIFSAQIAEAITPVPAQSRTRSFGQALNQLGQALSYPSQVRARAEIVRNVAMVVSLLGAVVIGAALIRGKKN